MFDISQIKRNLLQENFYSRILQENDAKVNEFVRSLKEHQLEDFFERTSWIIVENSDAEFITILRVAMGQQKEFITKMDMPKPRWS